MQRVEVRLDWGDAELLVGTLAEQDRRVYFEYATSFVESPLPSSPFKLPVRPGLFEHTERDFGEIFGVFNDSLPDGWGLLLMDCEFRRRGRAPVSVTVLDRFAYMGRTVMGALTYHPAARDIGDHDEELDLELLARAAERVLEGEAGDVLPELLRAGGSPGGARPKVVVGVGGDGRIISGAA
ncbi:MAG: HipA N-terminal domain-containing protein, partial [Gemmatimonadota bacterium]